MTIENCSVTDNLRNDILKLAKECGISTAIYSGKWEIQGGPHQTKALEAFYRAAFNAGLETAAKVCEKFDSMRWSGAPEEIRKLEMK